MHVDERIPFKFARYSLRFLIFPQWNSYSEISLSICHGKVGYLDCPLFCSTMTHIIFVSRCVLLCYRFPEVFLCHLNRG
jgi:hypothetical protein